MERQYPLINTLLVVIFLLMITISTALSWYTYVQKEQYRVVTEESDSPNALDLSTY